MKEHANTPSLLPYLDPETPCARLCVSLVSKEAGALEEVPFPFLVLSDGDPFSSLLDGQFLTDSGALLKDVGLLMQKDRYRFRADSPWEISNTSVEEMWQKAFAHYAARPDRFPLITLSRQVGEGGRLLPLAPLLFCKAQKRFFHPPCPSCGSPLSLCRDDEVLEKSGLPGFSSSLSRYLFCSSCMVTNPESVFFAYELENYDPPNVKDRFGFTGELGRLVENPAASPQFPCARCPEHPECYGLERKALRRIVPFSFYPFFLIIFESLPLKASDYLALAAGATWEEVERKLDADKALGRMVHVSRFREESEGRSPFLFRKDERFFLESLYLKLTFLAQLADKAFTTVDESGDFEPALSIDRTWVRPTGRKSHLPYFWNFEIQCVDVTGRLADLPTLRQLPASCALYSLGMSWFEALLSNSAQDSAEVFRAVRGLLHASPEAAGGQGETPAFASPVFQPQNLLWSPESRAFPKSWLEIWEECLHLGWTLIRAGLQGLSSFSGEDLLQRLKSLRRRIVDTLFAEMPAVLPEEKETPDEALHAIVSRIQGRWKERRAPAERQPAVELGDKTVVLPKHWSMEDTLPLDLVSLEAHGELTETVIVSPAATKETEPVTSPADRSSMMFDRREAEEKLQEMPDMEATFVSSPARKPDEEDLPTTLIVSPSREAIPGEPVPSSRKTDTPVEDLERTVSRRPEEPGMDEEGSAPAEEDLLMETVIIRPQAGKKPEKKDQ